MAPIWKIVLCALVAGSTARVLDGGFRHHHDVHAIFERSDVSTTSGSHDYNLSSSFINQELLSTQFLDGINLLGNEKLTLTCLNCSTAGTAQVSTPGINRNASFFSDVENLAQIAESEGFSAAVGSAISTNIALEFLDTSGSFDFSVSFSAATSHTFSLLTLPIIGLASPIDGAADDIGVIFLMEVILSVNTAADFDAGFEFDLGQNSSIVFDPIGGKILSFDFSKLTFNALPAEITDPDLAFTASLRATLQVGTSISVDILTFDKSVSFEAGVFVDIVKYQANVTTADDVVLNEGSMNSSSLSNSSAVVVTVTDIVTETKFVTATEFVAASLTSVSSAISTSAPSLKNGTGLAWNGTIWEGNATSLTLNQTSSLTNLTNILDDSIVCNSTALFQEELSIDIGAFAIASGSIVLDASFDFGDTVTTTLFALPLPSICL